MTFRTIAGLITLGTIWLSITSAAEPVRAGSKPRPAVAQRADGGFWRSDQGFKSELVLTNVLKTASLVVTPVLYLAEGSRYQLTPVTLPALGVARINVNDALADAPAAVRSHLSEFGSASIEYVGPWQAVLASVNCLDVGRSLVFTSRLSSTNSRFASAEDTARNNKLIVDEGAWWRHDPDVDGFVALMNTTASEKTVHLAIFPSRGSDMQAGAWVLGRTVVTTATSASLRMQRNWWISVWRSSTNQHLRAGLLYRMWATQQTSESQAD